MNQYDAMMRTGVPSQLSPNPDMTQVGNAEGAEAYKARALEYNNRLRKLGEQHSGSSYIPHEVAAEARRLRHERDNAINQWQELESKGAADHDRTAEFGDAVTTVPPTDQLFSNPPPGQGATDIPGKLKRRAEGLK